MAFQKAEWIWVDGENAPDTYGEFYDEFLWRGGKAVCRISCDGDYTLFVNGKAAGCNQYGDYEWYKSYDELDITPYLQDGKNRIAVLVWHFGAASQRYLPAPAGVIFEIEEGGQVCVHSQKSTLSRYSRAYKNGYRKIVTGQLGYSFLYDATKEDGWMNGALDGFTPSVPVNKNCTFVPRPVEKSALLAKKTGKLLENVGDKTFVFDLGEETVGLGSIAFLTEVEQKITLSWGEDLENGRVRRIVGPRDFSFEYIAKKGVNEYVNYMLRLGCRYLQIDSESPIKNATAALIPQVYPVTVQAYRPQNQRDREIYELCVNSLKLCMMEHYVDCPWREQCLYAFDSRNQMLSGYYAFEGGNAAYVRANLLLMSKDKRDDGLMSICYPCGSDLTIPSFSLYYVLSVKEYTEYTGDLTLAREVYPKICEMLDAFMAQRRDGLVCRFAGKNHWNFYDWSAHAEGHLMQDDVPVPDSQVNILTVMALTSLKRICALTGLAYPYGGADKEIAEKIMQKFYNEKAGALSVTAGGDEYTELANALAVAFGVVAGKKAEIICEKLVGDELLPCSLSMKAFKYDALLQTDTEKYRDCVLNEIRSDYAVMLDSGATATWETIEGATAFDHAGSLCHGWTAIPIYYFRKLL